MRLKQQKQAEILIVILTILSVVVTLKEKFKSLYDFKEYLLTVILCISVLGLILIYTKYKKPPKRRKSNLREVDYMKLDPYQFEAFCMRVLNANGYQMMMTSKSNDGGKDLVGWDNYNQRIFGEVKQYKKDNKVSRPLLQKLKGAMVDSKVERGIFITTSDFTREALEYAKRNKIKCINGNGLERLIRRT